MNNLLLRPVDRGAARQRGNKDATVVLLLTLLIKARVQIAAASALGIFLLVLQTLVFLAISGGPDLGSGGGATR